MRSIALALVFAAGSAQAVPIASSDVFFDVRFGAIPPKVQVTEPAPDEAAFFEDIEGAGTVTAQAAAPNNGLDVDLTTELTGPGFADAFLLSGGEREFVFVNTLTRVVPINFLIEFDLAATVVEGSGFPGAAKGFASGSLNAYEREVSENADGSLEASFIIDELFQTGVFQPFEGTETAVGRVRRSIILQPGESKALSVEISSSADVGLVPIPLPAGAAGLLGALGMLFAWRRFA